MENLQKFDKQFPEEFQKINNYTYVPDKFYLVQEPDERIQRYVFPYLVIL